MSYSNQELEQMAVEAIVNNTYVFITDVIVDLPISSSTFYARKLEESEIIKEALLRVRTKMKGGLRKKWYESTNSATQIALYRLIANKEELDALSQQKQEHSGEVAINITFNESVWEEDHGDE
jgi:hypothetical protein